MRHGRFCAIYFLFGTLGVLVSNAEPSQLWRAAGRRRAYKTLEPRARGQQDFTGARMSSLDVTGQPSQLLVA